jgi:hypothetical protein
MAPPAPRRRFPIVRVTLAVVLVVVLIAGYFVFVSTAKHPPDGFLYTEDSLTVHVLRYLHWTEANGQISGYWSIAEVKGAGKPTYGTGDLTGMQNGNEISLTFHPNFGDGTDTGTLENDVLTL